MPLKLSDTEIEKWKEELPELPIKRKQRYISELGLPEYDSSLLTADKSIADWFESVLSYTKNNKAVSNFIMGEIMRLLSEKGISIENCLILPETLAEIIKLVDTGIISNGAAKHIIDIIFDIGGNTKEIIEEHGLAQVSDDSELENWANIAIKENPKPAEEYKSGNAASINYLMGQVMKMSKGKANPGAVMKILKQILDS